MESIEEFGYPLRAQASSSAWGRLMAKIDTRNAAEAILEHKETLGHYEHKVFYIQEFVDKPGRDIRALAVDGEPIAAMTRSSDHWLTNAAKGGETKSFDLDDRALDLVERASEAVGGGMLGVDLMEVGGTGSGEYTVHEVNHTVEFKALDAATDVDVPAKVVDWLEEGRGGRRRGGHGMTDETYTASIVGGTGFTGGRCCGSSGHPDFEVVQATSRSADNMTVGRSPPESARARPALSDPDDLESVDVLFSATPHGVSMGQVDEYFEAADTVVDLGGLPPARGGAVRRVVVRRAHVARVLGARGVRAPRDQPREPLRRRPDRRRRL